MILIVNDNLDILEMLVHKHGGACYLTAEDGRKALSVFLENREKITSIITDYHMPVMDGFQFAKTVRALDPHLPISVFSCDPTANALFALLGVTALSSSPPSPE